MGNKMGDGGDKNKVYVANTSGSSYDRKSGETYTYHRNITRVRGGHPLLRLNPEAFDELDSKIQYDVEQATRAPSEKRGGAEERIGGRQRREAEEPPKPPEPEPEPQPNPDSDNGEPEPEEE